MGGRSSDKEDIGAAKRKSTGSHVGPVIEDVDDDADVGNGKQDPVLIASYRAPADWGAVGLSRKVTTEQQRSSQDANRLGLEKTVTQSQLRQENEQPFTPEELSKAITAAAVK